jgi:hypothetical protein
MSLPGQRQITRIGTRRVVAVALLALLLAQWAAWAHAFAHSTPEHRAAAAEAPRDWGHAKASPACQLVDQLLVGQATAGEPPTLARTRAQPVLQDAATPASLPAARLQAYEARGPPNA